MQCPPKNRGPANPANIQAKLQRNAFLAQTKFTQPDTCWGPGRNDVGFDAVTFTCYLSQDGTAHTPAAAIISDFLVRFNFQTRSFIIASIAIVNAAGTALNPPELSDAGIYFTAFSPVQTGIRDNGSQYTIQGTEPFIVLPRPALLMTDTIFRFKKPISQIYFTMANAGGPSLYGLRMTLASMDDIDLEFPAQYDQAY